MSVADLKTEEVFDIFPFISPLNLIPAESNNLVSGFISLVMKLYSKSKSWNTLWGIEDVRTTSDESWDNLLTNSLTKI